MSPIYCKLSSPIGQLFIVADKRNLLGVLFKSEWKKFKNSIGSVEEGTNIIIRSTKKQLGEYFKGQRKAFDLPYKLRGTSFQIKAWKSLLKIPYGETKSYKQQAAFINSRKAVRAIGQADGKNPICIILPCHRVVGSDGTLTGYAGGLRAKKLLLKLEGCELISTTHDAS